MIGYIYIIKSPNNKVYIGQTLNIENRIYRYKKLDCKRQTKLYNSFLKYGFDNHTFEIIETLELNDRKILDDREKFFISLYDSFEGGLNCNLGGGSNYGYKHSEETKIKAAKNRNGYRHSEETKIKIGKSCKGYIHKEETKNKISNSLKGRVAWNKGLKMKKSE